MSWISFKIHQIYPKFDEDRESVSCFDCSSTVEELSTNFWSTSGKFEFSNCLKVKSYLCSPHSIYQFKHSLSKEEEFIQYLFVSKESLDCQSSLKHECLMTDARCPSLLLSLCLENVIFLVSFFFSIYLLYSE